MKLGSGDIASPDDRRNRAAVLGNGDEVRGRGEDDMIAVDNLGVSAAGTPVE